MTSRGFVIEQWAYAAGLALMDSDPRAALDSFRVFERWADDELEPGHLAIAHVLVRQGWCQARLGRQAESAKLYSRAALALDRAVGPAHPATARLRTYLQACAVTGCDPAGPPDPPRAPERLAPFSPFGLGGVSGDILPAEHPVERERAATREHRSPGNGRDADWTGELGNTLGQVLAEIGEYELAAQAFKDYVVWAGHQDGAGHAYPLQAVCQLADCLSRLGDHAGSCRAYERARELLGRVDPASAHLTVLERMIARELFEAGRDLAWARRPTEALAVLEAAQARLALPPGRANEALAVVLTAQGWCKTELGEDDAAHHLYQEARRHYPPGDERRIAIDAYLGQGVSAFAGSEGDWR
jgi:tetratricopeptide (TPR) repeat protein